ncbi:mRNA splicing protein SAD1 NDAI_0B02140 [Naumovozyma dairenensis CBS 421]|uniref:USP domain-containing protein n=1 Tax=Naumovozyma dairenensis (strain ATCC 10597 / BCRC 20456 / CBS 421 / NBRC 0211 / NRRL Y-12639) TaxID=1071378 RepID=G0W638_NAUDC|nr:hypothetical protein NDAI_0B02140 [Naumovozyma dairenensis CBS 421]CCD23249.1 hypothetical protein NDAI_0B02140 [Naumovozyma dairenensis CBS 421]
MQKLKRRSSRSNIREESSKKIKQNLSDESKRRLLQTVNLHKLDFGLEKICSVTLSKLNVYCCLVCGKYFQGHNEKSPAFLHSINNNHNLFFNLYTSDFIKLPDAILIEGDHEPLLESIKAAFFPKYSHEEIVAFPKKCKDLNKRLYVNGFVRVTNSSSLDHLNVILLLLSHVTPLRDWLLLSDVSAESTFVQGLSNIVRKIWSPYLFKNHVSADEFADFLTVQNLINKLRNDPADLLIWMLNFMAFDSKALKRILHESCQGKINFNTRKTSQILPFWKLSLDLPVNSILKEGQNANNLHHVDLHDLLRKFTSKGNSNSKNYSLEKLPHFLVLHYNRFDFKSEYPVKNRNQILVQYPSVLKLKEVEYVLQANVVHYVKRNPNISKRQLAQDDVSNWKIQLCNELTKKWIEIDANQTTNKDAELLFLNETYLQVWKRTNP